MDDNRTPFVCDDCDSEVYTFPALPVPDPPLCSVCQWLREFVPDSAERDAMRARLR